mmetsp:Transcript_47058/g.145103  ORF Transcript_47058/g.145103 Transcript_47058/m.145103 type:complete len:83 (-) Transcript_47058:22-270(-)
MGRQGSHLSPRDDEDGLGVVGQADEHAAYQHGARYLRGAGAVVVLVAALHLTCGKDVSAQGKTKARNAVQRCQLRGRDTKVQ